MSNKVSLSASDRINALLDDSSFVEVGAYVTARSTDFNMQETDTPKDGVITGYGVINGKLVYVYSQDAKVLGGAIGEMHAKKIAKIYDMAIKVGGYRSCGLCRTQTSGGYRCHDCIWKIIPKADSCIRCYPTDYCNIRYLRWWSSTYPDTYRLYIYDNRGIKVIC